MEHKDSSKPRRQLPAIPVPHPPSDQPLAAPAVADTPVTPATFYSTSNSVTARPQQPPPLPARRHQAGSSFTNYQQIDGEYREPELVQDDQTSRPAQTVPGTWSTSTDIAPAWGASRPEWEPTDVWHDAWNGGEYHDWGEVTGRRVNIDGRVEEEELRWWDPSVRQTHNRPGQGILPTLLENYLHNADHTLFSVSASPPEVKPRHRSSESISHPPVNPPSADEVRRSIPHPNAYYCRKHNGWVLLLWKSSAIDPPLSKSYDGPPLPDITHRLRNHSCVGENPQSATQVNKTHHFHYYGAAVDASKITTPFKRADWEHHPRTKSRRRKAVLIDHSNLSTAADGSQQPEGEPLDLYVCCQCPLYCVVSDVIPGVIPQRTFDAFVKDRLDHPHLGKTPAMSLAAALDTILM
jgi:ubiquitin carboxyl-terminal hydrolase 25/28